MNNSIVKTIGYLPGHDEDDWPADFGDTSEFSVVGDVDVCKPGI